MLTQVVAAAPPPTSSNVAVQMGGIDSLLQASFIVQLVLLILISLSILCWAIGWAKYKQFKSLKLANELFDQQFFKMSSLDDMFEKVNAHADSSHARVFKSAYLEMKKIAESPLLSKNNPVDLKMLEDCLKSAFFLIHPTKMDTMGAVIVEAGYYGCPSIASDKFGIPDLVVDGQTGFLLNEISANTIAEILFSMYESRDKYSKIRVATREWFVREFSWDSIGRKVIGFMNQNP